MTSDRDWFDAQPQLARKLLEAATSAQSIAEFWALALPLAQAATAARTVAVLQFDAGNWQTFAAVGAALAPPSDLCSEALDREDAVRAGTWLVTLLTQRAAHAELLAVGWPDAAGAAPASAVSALVTALRPAAAALRERQTLRARAQRLETILAIAGQWHQTLELHPLLERMAEASTRLLDAERASIFLWDRKARWLIGRPALGVPDGELRVADNKGVVGQVVQSGQPRRVGAADAQREIDHTVDQQLKFRTRSLLCVPLRDQSGELLGAFEVLNKKHGDFTADDEAALIELAAHAAIPLANSRRHEHVQRSRVQVANQAAAHVQLIGECPAIQQLRQTIERVANTDLAVLVLGENGTGKEVVAQLIHYLSRRRNEPFVAVNCAALPDTLLESELFGHEKGAFTDARDTRQGKFELASGGTLMLDEIGDMSLSGQAKLLRVLEEKVVTRVGGSTPIHTDTRIIAATNQKLVDLVQQKRFRQDLYFRLTVVTLDLPPLRERGDDSILLAEHFLRGFCAKARRALPPFTAAARKRLLGHGWPGNVRELRNLMERLAYLSTSDKLDADELAFIMSPAAPPPSLLDGDATLGDATQEFQIAYIRQHIERARGNMTDAAERLGLHRSNLYRKMHQLGMPTTDEE